MFCGYHLAAFVLGASNEYVMAGPTVELWPSDLVFCAWLGTEPVVPQAGLLLLLLASDFREIPRGWSLAPTLCVIPTPHVASEKADVSGRG